MTNLFERLETLAWVERTKGAYAALVAEVGSLSDLLDERTREHERLGDLEKSMAKRVGEREERKASLTRALAKTRSELERGRTVLDGMQGWQTKTERLRTIKEEEEALRKAVLDGSRSMERLQAALQAEEEEEQRLTAEIGVIEERQGDLNELIGALEDHIEDGVCPTCGQDHGSRRELLERISTQLGREVATDERVARESTRRRVEEVRSSIGEEKKKENVASGGLAALGEERDALAAEVEAFQGRLSEFGLLVGNYSDMARNDVTTQFTELERQCDEQTAELSSETDELEIVRGQWEATTRLIGTTQDEITELSDRLEVAKKERGRLVNDPRNQGDVNLFTPPEKARARTKSTETEVQSARQLVDEEADALRSARESLRVSEAELAASEGESNALVGEIAKLTARCQEIESRLSDNDVEVGESPKVVLDRAGKVAEDASLIKMLIEDVANAELVIDAATTRAAYRQLQSRLAGRRSAVSKLRSTRDSYAWWLEYFRAIMALVTAEQNKAISRFTNAYGPRTSIIQRRLRSVYGFDDIEIRSEGPNIVVRVLRDGKLLKPTDYFSQSQQQTLLLGMFLTACVSQNWSGLAPVFLDDPIAHFDDLNVFAFLDLMDGLMNDYGAGKRQLIISTCDHKFIELAREKFAYRGENVKYYTFEGIGDEGPILQPS